MEDDRLGPGDSSPVIATCKRKLGVFPDDEVYTDQLAQRIRGLRLAHGLEVHGLIDDEVLEILGVEGG